MFRIQSTGSAGFTLSITPSALSFFRCVPTAESLLVVVRYRIPGWLHRLEPVLVSELHRLDLHPPHSISEHWSLIPADDPVGLLLALGLDLVHRRPLGDDLLACLPVHVGDADVVDVLVVLALLGCAAFWVVADDTEISSVVVPEAWPRLRPRHHVHPGSLGRSAGGG